MEEKVSLDSLKNLEKQLSQLLEQMSQEVSHIVMSMEEHRVMLSASNNELTSREQNVIRMEKSIREHMQSRGELEARLTDASNKQNTDALKMQLLESEKEKLQKTLEQTEERLAEVLKENEELTGKYAECMVMNQKLSDEKAKLLKLQIENGGI